MHTNELSFSVERLEQRKMMAADVSVSGSTLHIKGDSTDEYIQVAGTGSEGSVFVRQNNEDTFFNGIRNVKVDLRGGDDRLIVAGIQIENDLHVKMGDGADYFLLSVEPPVTDFIDVVIGDDVIVDMGNDVRDEIHWRTKDGVGQLIAVGDDVTLRGAASVYMRGYGKVDGRSTTAFEAEDIVIGDRLNITVSDKRVDMYGPPEIDLKNVNVAGKTRLIGSRVSDEVILEHCNFRDDFYVSTRGGDDAIVMERNNRFHDRAVFHGGAGLDTLGNPQNRTALSFMRDYSFEFVVDFDDI